MIDKLQGIVGVMAGIRTETGLTQFRNLTASANLTPCSFVEGTNVSEELAAPIPTAGDGGRWLLRNAGIREPIYTASHPTRQRLVTEGKIPLGRPEHVYSSGTAFGRCTVQISAGTQTILNAGTN
jgi:hypothetical protein